MFRAIFTIIVFLFSLTMWVDATVIEDLQKSIEEKNQEIQRLEAVAKTYRDKIELNQLLGKTFKDELSRIDNYIKKLLSEVTLTERKIQRAELEINYLSKEIKETELSINKLRVGLANMIQILSESDQYSPWEIFIKNGFLSDFFQYIEQSLVLKNKVLSTIKTLSYLQDNLLSKKSLAEEKREDLGDLQKSLKSRRALQENTRKEKKELLLITKNQEKLYQNLLREQGKKRAALEDEIHEIEAKIRVTIDPTSLPQKGKGVLGSPLEKIALLSCFKGIEAAKNCLTQFFGHTSFAASGVYGDKGHNGVDFRAQVGTPVFAADNGTVKGTGDTDVGCRKASYGKWILIDHPNNLSTLYAHLGSIEVVTEQRINRGERIALSGKSGYATGPHLHFSVFASQALRIEQIRSRVCARLMTLPISAINGYLNPLDYL